MSDEQKPKQGEFNSRDVFIEKWAKMFKCKPDAYSVSAELVNHHKNFQSACAVVFNLSFRYHKEWLVASSDYLKKMWSQYPKEAKADASWMYQFQQHYINEVAKYPE